VGTDFAHLNLRIGDRLSIYSARENQKDEGPGRDKIRHGDFTR